MKKSVVVLLLPILLKGTVYSQDTLVLMNGKTLEGIITFQDRSFKVFKDSAETIFAATDVAGVVGKSDTCWVCYRNAAGETGMVCLVLSPSGAEVVNHILPVTGNAMTLQKGDLVQDIDGTMLHWRRKPLSTELRTWMAAKNITWNIIGKDYAFRSIRWGEDISKPSVPGKNNKIKKKPAETLPGTKEISRWERFNLSVYASGGGHFLYDASRISGPAAEVGVLQYFTRNKKETFFFGINSKVIRYAHFFQFNKHQQHDMYWITTGTGPHFSFKKQKSIIDLGLILGGGYFEDGYYKNTIFDSNKWLAFFIIPHWTFFADVELAYRYKFFWVGLTQSFSYLTLGKDNVSNKPYAARNQFGMMPKIGFVF